MNTSDTAYTSLTQQELEQHIWDLLREIPDPEIPTINLVDLGIIRKVIITDNAAQDTSPSWHIRVEMMPTFVGCPALDMMKRDIQRTLSLCGTVDVKVVYSEVWTTERITEAGRTMLCAAGLTPPPRKNVMTLPMYQQAVAHQCPHCGSQDTHLDNLFGPTPCRAIGYCEGCHQPFEQFKAV
ncbi:MAG TPA: phenylacetate-CoA oxygenase subunit PaaJ [Ktedonobacter sp.]|nr:phenylacetate-CoA oxygenase subunit PaaJ [Ktedonobacter sp.]